MGPCFQTPPIASGAPCTPRCTGQNQAPSISKLQCIGGLWSPPGFKCIDVEEEKVEEEEKVQEVKRCLAPKSVAFAVTPLCAEELPDGPGFIADGDGCTPECVSGYIPSATLLSC